MLLGLKMTKSSCSLTIFDVLAGLRLLEVALYPGRESSVAQTLVVRVVKVFRGARHELSVQEVLRRVLKNGWQTKSRNPRARIWETLARNPTLFRRVRRGTYQLKIGTVKLMSKPRLLPPCRDYTHV